MVFRTVLTPVVFLMFLNNLKKSGCTELPAMFRWILIGAAAVRTVADLWRRLTRSSTHPIDFLRRSDVNHSFAKQTKSSIPSDVDRIPAGGDRWAVSDRLESWSIWNIIISRLFGSAAFASFNVEREVTVNGEFGHKLTMNLYSFQQGN